MILCEDAIQGMPERMKRELIRGEHARAEFDLFAQGQIKEALTADQPQRHINGAGAKLMTIGAGLAARIRTKYNRPGNIDCLHDPEFLRALLRDNPFLRTGSRAGRLALRVDGFRDGSRRLEADPATGGAGSANTHGHEIARAAVARDVVAAGVSPAGASATGTVAATR